MAKIDLDFFEKILFQNILKKDTIFLASVVEYLDKKLFRNKDIGEIIDIIKTFYLERDTIPSLTEIKAHLTTAKLKEHFVSAVESLRGLDSSYNQVELIKNTEYFLKQRKYHLLVEKAVEMQSETKEIDSEEIQKELEKIHTISLVDNLGLDYFAETERVIEYLLQKDKFISTGYMGMDNAIGGGMMREGRALYCIGGETNVGKSIVLANVAVNVLLQDMNVIIHTLEMSEMRYAKRISAILTNIALATLPENIRDYKAYIEDFKSKYQSRLIIKEFATKSVSAKHLFAFTKTLERRKNFVPHLQLFDYPALMIPSVRQPSKHTEMQFVAQEVRGLTYVFNSPGMCVAQLNRGSHKAAKPGLDNASGSWDQIGDFDAWVNLAQTEQDREANLLRYSGDKARDGGKGQGGALRIDYDTLRLYDDEHTIGVDEASMPEHNVVDTLNLADLYK